MTLSLPEISDRLEIQDQLVDYCHAIDTRNWEALDHGFTPDAVIDYTERGGTRGTLAETKTFLATAMANFAGFQHLIATSKVTWTGHRDGKDDLPQPDNRHVRGGRDPGVPLRTVVSGRVRPHPAGVAHPAPIRGAQLLPGGRIPG